MIKLVYRTVKLKTFIRVSGKSEKGIFQIEIPLKRENKRETLLELGLLICCHNMSDKIKEDAIRAGFEIIAHINKKSSRYELEYALNKFIDRVKTMLEKEIG